MANIFKSKEVYKHVTKPGNVHQLIPVRGVYVASQYREPYYIDHMLSITNVGGQPGTIITYTESEVDAYSYDMGGSIDVTNIAPTVTSYTTASITTYTDYTVGIGDLSVTNSPPTIVSYTQNSITVYAEFEVGHGELSITNNTITVNDITTSRESEIDSFLQIKEITSNDATIS